MSLSVIDLPDYGVVYMDIKGNKWDARSHTLEEAEKLATTIVESTNNYNCSNIINCHSCVDCHSCNACFDCENCSNLHMCENCIDCHNSQFLKETTSFNGKDV